MARNVGITLTDLAYEVWKTIPHGLRAKVISEFLIENARTLSKLEPLRNEGLNNVSVAELLADLSTPRSKKYPSDEK